MKEEHRELARHLGSDGRRTTGLVTGFLLATLVAPLPPTWRAGIEQRLGLDVGPAAGLSGALQVFGGLGLAVAGFFGWMDATMGAVAAAAQASGSDPQEQAMMGMASLWMNPLLPVIWAVTTPLGWISTFTWIGGGARLMALALSREAVPDPTLHFIEWVRCKILRRVGTQAREKSKGPPAPDCLFVGDARSGWDLCIVSRDDHAWREGASVIVNGTAHRLMRKFEMRDENGWLRNVYELQRLGPTDVLRGMNAYRPTSPPRVVG